MFDGSMTNRPPSFPPPPMSSRFPAGAVPTVAFLGTGAMGAPMAANLVRKGFPVQVWNRHHERTQPVVALGAKQKSTPAECAAGCRFVVTMLRDDQALFSVLERADGVLTGIDKDTVLVDMSTVGRAAALRAAQLVRDVGSRFVDAPVSGSVAPAEKGELVALVGGRLNDVTRVQPVLNAMCRRIIHAGDVGQGQALKVLLNGIGTHHLVAFTSMLVLGERAGIPRRSLVEAFTTGAFASPSYVGKKEKVLAKDFSPEFTLALTLKDAKLNVELQQEVGLPLPIHREALRAIEKAVEEGLGEEDLYALEKYYRGL
jgi:3-hydroxyisobutyrate dehydrogenase-like beta-hydroxyacid dehydrogenase